MTKARKIVNKDETKPTSANIRRRIKTETQVYRIRQDIQKWRNAVVSAENIYNPTRLLLYQTYQDVMLDAHLTAAINQRKSLILSKSFQVINPDGTVNEEKTKIIQAKWFRDFINLSLDSIFWGYSLIQFDSIVEDAFKCVELVPRIYVKPEFHIVTENYAEITGTDYLENPFKNWVIGVGESRDLGLLMKAAPLAIWKKNAMASWAEFVEVFGTPIRVGKTNTRDEATRGNMEDMLKNMGTAAWGVFDLEDVIELIETKRSDVFQVYDMMIARCNSEISKLILTVTGTMDEKSFVGSAEVMERMLEKTSFADEVFLEGVNNYQLIPLLNAHGFGFEGLKIKIAKEEKFTLDQKGKFDIELIKTGKYKFTPEYLKENYGSEVTEIEQEDNSIQEVKNRLNQYYS